MEESQKNKKPLLFSTQRWALVLSFVLHTVFLFPNIHWGPTKPLAQVEENKAIRVVLTSPSERKQIVATEKGREEEPVDSRFMGEKNQSFDRQTTATDIGSFKNAGKGIRQGADAIAPGAPKPKKKESMASAKPGKKKRKISLGDLSIGDSEPDFDTEGAEMAQALGLENGIASEMGLGRNNDYVDDIPLGDVTNLNTIEYKYYGFYHRIKQRLEQHWGSSLKEKAAKLYRTGRRIPANENKVTSLLITLDTKGNIVDIAVKTTSGVRELDDAAIESFNRAGPFPNPPQGMMVDGRAKIEWGFVVKS
jgi:protein TonB